MTWNQRGATAFTGKIEEPKMIKFTKTETKVTHFTLYKNDGSDMMTAVTEEDLAAAGYVKAPYHSVANSERHLGNRVVLFFDTIKDAEAFMRGLGHA